MTIIHALSNSIIHAHQCALFDLTKSQLDEAFLSLFPMRQATSLSKRDLWVLLRRNIERIPDLVRASVANLHGYATRSMDLYPFHNFMAHANIPLTRQAATLVDWFSAVFPLYST